MNRTLFNCFKIYTIEKYEYIWLDQAKYKLAVLDNII